jgi:hypothetical protein
MNEKEPTAEEVSTAQRSLDQGKYLIAQFEGYWYMIHPPSSPWIEILGDYIFRTGFDAGVPEQTVREFYVKQLQIEPRDIVRAAPSGVGEEV